MYLKQIITLRKQELYFTGTYDNIDIFYRSEYKHKKLHFINEAVKQDLTL